MNDEITRLHKIIDRAAKAWLALEPGVAWEGDVADAMKAAVTEITRLRAEVESLKRTMDLMAKDVVHLQDTGPHKQAQMRALMVLVDDEIISEGRAREIVGWTADQQRAFWRSESRVALTEREEALRAELADQREMRERIENERDQLAATQCVAPLVHPHGGMTCGEVAKEREKRKALEKAAGMVLRESSHLIPPSNFAIEQLRAAMEASDE